MGVVGDVVAAVRISSHQSVHQMQSGKVVSVPIPARQTEVAAAAGDEEDRIRWGVLPSNTIRKMWISDVPYTE